MGLEKEQGRLGPSDDPSRGASSHQQAAAAGSGGGPATLTTAALPPPQPPPDAIPPAALRLHQATAILGTMAHAAITVSQWHGARSSAGRLQTVLILLALAATAATTLLFPAFYWTYR